MIESIAGVWSAGKPLWYLLRPLRHFEVAPTVSQFPKTDGEKRDFNAGVALACSASLIGNQEREESEGSDDAFRNVPGGAIGDLYMASPQMDKQPCRKGGVCSGMQGLMRVLRGGGGSV